MCDGRLRFLGFALTLLAVLSRPVFAEPQAYEIQPKRLVVRLDLTLETAGSEVIQKPCRLEIPLDAGRLPAGTLSTDQAILRDWIDLQSDWLRPEQDEAVQAADRGFADLEKRIDRFLLSLPDRLDARQTGPLGIALTFQDFDFGQLETLESFYDSSRGYVQSGGRVLEGGSFGDGWLALNLGLLDTDLSFPERSMIWTASTDWIGRTEDGTRLLVSLELEIQARILG